MHTLGESTIFFSTHMDQKTTKQIRCVDANMVSFCTEQGVQHLWQNNSVTGVCSCSWNEHYLMVGVEEMQMAFQHSYRVERVGKIKYQTNHDITTIVRSYDRKETYIFPPIDVPCNKINEPKDKILTCVKDEEVKLSNREWLQLAGVNLDELNTDVEDTRATPYVLSNTKKPYIRITGVGIDINVRYYNMRLYTQRTSGNLYAFVDVRARRGWFLGPAHVYYRDFPQIPLESPARSIPRASFSPTGNSVTRKSYGLKYSFEIGGGAIGEFDWQQLKKELIDSLVLYGLVTAVLNLIALYGFGYNSYIYTEQMRNGPLGEIRELYVKKLVYAILFGNDDSVDFQEFQAFLGKYG